MHNRDTWTGTFRRLILDDRPVRIGWFATLERALALPAEMLAYDEDGRTKSRGRDD